MTPDELLHLTVDIKSMNHAVISVNGYKILKSYNETIAVISPKGTIGLGPKWKYSRTTSKHRNEFLQETATDTQEKLIDGEYILLEGSE